MGKLGGGAHGSKRKMGKKEKRSTAGEIDAGLTYRLGSGDGGGGPADTPIFIFKHKLVRTTQRGGVVL